MNFRVFFLNAHLRKDEDGRLVYFPWGRKQKGYFIPNEPVTNDNSVIDSNTTILEQFFIDSNPEILEQIFIVIVQAYLGLPIIIGLSSFLNLFMLQQYQHLPMRLDVSLFLTLSNGDLSSIVLAILAPTFTSGYFLLRIRRRIFEIVSQLESCDKKYSELSYPFDD